MTIERGKDWGVAGRLPGGADIVSSDAELRALVEPALIAGERPPPIGVVGGDLCRTLGGTGSLERLRSDDAMHLPVDAVAVEVNGVEHWFVAHLVARALGWHGSFAVAMNAQFLGTWNLGPRGHPNDGRVDVTEGRLSLADRLKARSRLPSGAHIPHPSLSTSQTSAVQISFDRPRMVRLDGERIATADTLAVRVEPDALTVVV